MAVNYRPLAPFIRTPPRRQHLLVELCPHRLHVGERGRVVRERCAQRGDTVSVVARAADGAVELRAGHFAGWPLGALGTAIAFEAMRDAES